MNMKEDIFSEKLKLDFCNRLRSLRNKQGISAREMSLSLGQNVNYINLIENGKRLPSMEGFFFICEYFGLTPVDFFGGEKNEPETLDEAAQQADQDILSKLSPLQTHLLAALIKSLAS